MQYDREKDIPRIMPFVNSNLLKNKSAKGTQQIIDILKAEHRDERRRGLLGHWSYIEQRHAALVNALRAEEAYLAEITKEDAA